MNGWIFALSQQNPDTICGENRQYTVFAMIVALLSGFFLPSYAYVAVLMLLNVPFVFWYAASCVAAQSRGGGCYEIHYEYVFVLWFIDIVFMSVGSIIRYFVW